MSQPNRGSVAPSAPTSQPIEGKKTPTAPSKGEVKFGHASGGVKGK